MTYRIHSTSLVHSPGVYRSAMRCYGGTFNEETEDVAAKLYMLTAAFGDLPGHVLLSLAMGEIEPKVEGETLMIEVPDARS